MPTYTKLVFVPRAYTYYSITPSSNQTFSVNRTPYTGSFIVTKDGSLAGYKAIIARGDNATTSLSGSGVGVSDDNCTFEYTINFNPSGQGPPNFNTIGLRGPLMSQIPPPSLGGVSGYLPIADNLAISRFYQALAATQSSFKGQVVAGELRETLQMIKSPAKALRSGIGDYLQAIKRWSSGKKSTRRQKQSFVRDTWLEYSFGWRPLISDIDDGIRSFFASRWPYPIFQMVRGSGRAGGVTPYSVGNTWDIGNGMYIFFDVDAVVEAQIKYYGSYHSTGNGPTTFAHYGFSPWEFVPTLWELIPYSFLVDYFTNIGDIISAWSYRSIGCKWASKGTLEESRIQTARAQPKYLGATPWPWTSSGSPGSSTAWRRSVGRTSSVNIPLPNLQLEVPGMSSRKWINIAALSTQLSATRRSLRSP